MTKSSGFFAGAALVQRPDVSLKRLEEEVAEIRRAQTLATADTRRLREIEARLVAIEGALADAGAKTLAEAQRLRNGLEARLVAVESKSPHPLTFADAYQGDYLPRRSYARGAIVRHARGLWLALEDTDAVPGGAAAWRLLLKGAA